MPPINDLCHWNGTSDIILITETDGGIQMRICPAAVVHRVVAEYRAFVASHRVVFESVVEGEQVVVTARWEMKE